MEGTSPSSTRREETGEACLEVDLLSSPLPKLEGRSLFPSSEACSHLSPLRLAAYSQSSRQARPTSTASAPGVSVKKKPSSGSGDLWTEVLPVARSTSSRRVPPLFVKVLMRCEHVWTEGGAV